MSFLFLPLTCSLTVDYWLGLPRMADWRLPPSSPAVRTMKSTNNDCVAVEELKLSYQNGNMYQLIWFPQDSNLD